MLTEANRWPAIGKIKLANASNSPKWLATENLIRHRIIAVWSRKAQERGGERARCPQERANTLQKSRHLCHDTRRNKEMYSSLLYRIYQIVNSTGVWANLTEAFP